MLKEIVSSLEGTTLVEDCYHGYLIRIELSGRTFMEVTEKYQRIIDVFKLFYQESRLQERYAEVKGVNGSDYEMLVNMFIWK